MLVSVCWSCFDFLNFSFVSKRATTYDTIRFLHIWNMNSSTDSQFRLTYYVPVCGLPNEYKLEIWSHYIVSLHFNGVFVQRFAFYFSIVHNNFFVDTDTDNFDINYSNLFIQFFSYSLTNLKEHQIRKVPNAIFQRLEQTSWIVCVTRILNMRWILPVYVRIFVPDLLVIRYCGAPFWLFISVPGSGSCSWGWSHPVQIQKSGKFSATTTSSQNWIIIIHSTILLR